MSGNYVKTSGNSTSPTLADNLGIGDRYKKKPKKKKITPLFLNISKTL